MKDKSIEPSCKLFYKQTKETFGNKPCYTQHHEKDPEFCCKQLEDAWNDGFICFGEYEYTYLNTNKELNIAKCYPYPEGVCWDELAIKFCPFCGTEIQLIEIEEQLVQTQ